MVLSAYYKMQRGNDCAHLFEQESNFWWLTGVEHSDWMLVIDGAREKSWLVAPKVSGAGQIFDGSLSHEDAIRVSGVDEIIDAREADALLRQLARRHSVAYTLGDLPHAEHLDFVQNSAQKELRQRLERIFSSVQDCRKELARLRAIKQPEEILAIKRAVNLTVKSFELVASSLDQFKYEYEIEAEFSYYFRKNGAKGHAYDPIIACGKNACTLHYSDNESRLKKRSLVLMDVGARCGGYAADITRTYACGEPTIRQKTVHDAINHAHSQIISLLGPGLPVADYIKQVDEIMKESLMDLGLLKDRSDNETYRKYFPHAVSHGLGIDVHDSLGAPRYFEPGMVVTVEPGVYVPAESLGVRIEDNILITESGRDNLSGKLSTAIQ